MQITWFGHSCFRIDLAASHILIDPFLTGNSTFEDANIPFREVVRGVTHVALTHGHEDHSGDSVKVCKETGAPLLAVHELATYLAGKGVGGRFIWAPVAASSSGRTTGRPFITWATPPSFPTWD
jgi:L-ascorbate metabolism protein UlaG (beta-lactamase superfamily)